MKNSRRGQTLVEVLTTAAILGIILIGSVTGYRNYARGDSEIRSSLVAASLNSSFSQLSKDAYLVEEMFFGQRDNARFRACLEEGSCPSEWQPLSYDEEAAWPYVQAKVSFDFRAKEQDIVELRMRSESRRPTVVWLSRYDYLNLNSKLTKIACPHRRVIGGVDFSSGTPICVDPTQPKAPEARR
jgi:Tfp pilus assembly protein PilE